MSGIQRRVNSVIRLAFADSNKARLVCAFPCVLLVGGAARRSLHFESRPVAFQLDPALDRLLAEKVRLLGAHAGT